MFDCHVRLCCYRAAVKELSPFTLRLGGSLEDYITYAIDDNDPCPPLVANASVQFKFSGGCLTKQRWSELAHLCKDAGCRVVFGLNQLVGRTHVADKKWTGSWDSSNTEKLLRYTYDSGLEVYGFELGNELGGWNGIAAQLTPQVERCTLHRKKGCRRALMRVSCRSAPQETAEDFLRLSHLLHDIWGPSHKTVPKLIGPDNTLDEEWFRVFLSSVGPALDAVTIHLYALGPGKDMSLPSKILDPRHDALAIETAANLSRMVGSAGPEMWMGEDGGAYNSGQNGTTNRFISAFWSLTELGTFARAGFSVYCRQTLLGGNYGLIDKDTLKPNPDFFAFLLFKRLMGPRALEVKTDSGDPYLKVFAHCSRPVAGGAKGGVALLLINFHPSEDVRIGNIGTRNILHSGPRQEYLMTSPGLVNGTVAYLNGKPLVLTEQGEYPVLQAVTRSAGEPISLPPLSYAFQVFPKANVESCLQ